MLLKTAEDFRSGPNVGAQIEQVNRVADLAPIPPKAYLHRSHGNCPGSGQRFSEQFFCFCASSRMKSLAVDIESIGIGGDHPARVFFRFDQRNCVKKLR
ncbi:hypothetical protein [Pseudomonas sp. Marseille-Q7302]